VREEDTPAVANPLVKLDATLGGVGLKVRSGGSETDAAEVVPCQRIDFPRRLGGTLTGSDARRPLRLMFCVWLKGIEIIIFGGWMIGRMETDAGFYGGLGGGLWIDGVRGRSMAPSFECGGHGFF